MNYLLLAIYIYAAIVVLILIFDDRDPSSTLAWLIVLILLPVFGVFFYLLAGRNWRRIAQRRSEKFVFLRTDADKMMEPIYSGYHADADKLREKEKDNYTGKIISLIEKNTRSYPLPASNLETFTNGTAKFAKLKEDIKRAKKYVHIQYFIWREDSLSQSITKILIERLKAGVEVRVMYDFVGSFARGKKSLRLLKRNGAQVVSDVKRVNKINYRNHRKIVVIDGDVGYTGGMNVGQEYIDGGKRFETWRDTHVRIEGQFVTELQKLFFERWYMVTKENLFKREYFPIIPSGTSDKKIMLQMVGSSIDEPWETIKQSYLIAILNAQKQVLIQSPYFVPDAPLYEAMITAALSGVDVKLMMTGIPDHVVVFWAAFPYFEKLFDAGVKIYHYKEGFFHPKTITVDSKVSSVGTTNFDIRSFSLQNELTVFIYDKEEVKKQEEIFFQDMEKCKLFTRKDYSKIGVIARLRNSLARLTSRVL